MSAAELAGAAAGEGRTRAGRSLARTLQRLWTRAARRLRRRRASFLAPTALGWTVGAIALSALWWYGFGALDLLLFVIGICGLGLLALSALLVLGTALYLRRSAERGRSTLGTLEAGSPLRTGYSLPALRALPLVQLDWEWRSPAGVQVRTRLSEGRLYEEVIAQRRAQESTITRRIRVESAFGLARVWWDVDEHTPLTIRPWTGRLQRSAVIHSLASADGTPHPSGAPEGDRMDLRRYAPGDSARHILWARYAKTRELVVRTHERSIDRTRRIVAYLVTGPGDEPAAAAARVALESGALGDSWIFGADGSDEPRADLPGALELIARSGSLPASSDIAGAPSEPQAAGRGGPAAGGLARFLQRIDGQGAMHCVVFAPGRPGPWLPAVLECLRGRGGRLSFVLGVDGIARPGARPRWWRRALLREPQSPGVPPEPLSKVSDMLVRSGGSVVIADRHSGRYHGELHAHAELRGGRA